MTDPCSAERFVSWRELEAIAGEATTWRHYLHQHPELGFEVNNTAAFVAEKLKSFGFSRVDVGLGRSGVVGELIGSRSREASSGVALRADIDALPILEANGFGHASRYKGRMHACGHDGHTAMLLAAAAYLSRHRDRVGRVVFVFQPAEEGLAGARAMLEDGLIERYRIARAFALHNRPGMRLRSIGITPGPVMAAADRITFLVHAKGGHAALPHHTVDPVVVGSSIVLDCQAIISRAISPMAPAVLTIPVFEAGTVRNVIPDKVRLHGTLRSLDDMARNTIHAKLRFLAGGKAIEHSTPIDLDIEEGYPATVNNEAIVDEILALGDAAQFDIERVEPMMASDDFGYMLERVPGAYIFIGNGESAGLHEPGYDFDDRLIFEGARFWVELAMACCNPSLDRDGSGDLEPTDT